MIDQENIVIQSVSDFFRKTNLTYNLFLAVPLIIFIFLFLEKRENGWVALITDDQYAEYVSYFCFPVALALLYFGYRGFYERIRMSPPDGELIEKLTWFYKSFIVQQFFFGGSSLLSLIALYLTGNSGFVVVYVLILFISSILRPSDERVAKSLRLNREEREVVSRKKHSIKEHNKKNVE